MMTHSTLNAIDDWADAPIQSRQQDTAQNRTLKYYHRKPIVS